MTAGVTTDGQRILIIGAGYIARQHAAAVRLLPGGDSARIAVADPVPAAREGFLAEFPAAHAVADPAELLAGPGRPDDIVIVATPPFTHRDLAVAALRSGRHVLCEKPLAMTAAEAGEMLDAARAADRLLGCCSSRFLDTGPTARARRLIADGALGPLYHATWVHRIRRGRPGIEYQPASRWFLDRSRSGGGVLLDWGCYDLTTLFDVLAPRRVTVLSAWTTSPATGADPTDVPFDVEEQVGATLLVERRGGERLTVTYERAAATHGAGREIAEIEGRDGAVRWDWVDWSGDGAVTVSRDEGGAVVEATERPVADVPEHAHWRPLVQFAAAVRGEPADAVTDERAVFHFTCLQAIYDVAADSRPRTVVLGETITVTAGETPEAQS